MQLRMLYSWALAQEVQLAHCRAPPADCWPSGHVVQLQPGCPRPDDEVPSAHVQFVHTLVDWLRDCEEVPAAQSVHSM